MYKFIAILTIFLAFANAQVAIPCTRNPGAVPQTTVVEGCNSPPCSLLNGKVLNIRMSFRAPRPLNNMLTLVTSYFNLINGILTTQINLGPAANTCNTITNRRCPVSQGDLVDITLPLNITGVPMMHNIPFEFRVVDHGPMLCVQVPIRAIG